MKAEFLASVPYILGKQQQSCSRVGQLGLTSPINTAVCTPGTCRIWFWQKEKWQQWPSRIPVQNVMGTFLAYRVMQSCWKQHLRKNMYCWGRFGTICWFQTVQNSLKWEYSLGSSFWSFSFSFGPLQTILSCYLSCWSDIPPFNKWMIIWVLPLNIHHTDQYE